MLPMRPGQGKSRRLIAVAGVAVAIAGAGLVFFGPGGDDYRLTAVVPDAGQLVPGNVVKVSGLTVGSVSDIRLTDDGQAELVLDIDDGDFTPLHEGTRATVRLSSLSSVANRYVALTPGPNNRATLQSGARIDADSTETAVDIDQLLNTLDQQSRSALQDILHGSASALEGRSGAARGGLEALNPALAQTSATFRELMRDQTALERFIVESSAVVSALAPRAGDLEQAIAGGAEAADALAGEAAALSQTLELAPSVLRRANTALVNTRVALGDVRPTARLARPAARRLGPFLRRLAPVARGAVPALADLRALLPGATDLVRRLPRLERVARPAFGATVEAIRGSTPIVAGSRVALPDVFHGLIGGFGGLGAGWYDANGAYARVSAQAGQYSLTGGGNLLPLAPLSGSRPGNTRRCPGSATQPAPDGSTPVASPQFPCAPEQHP